MKTYATARQEPFLLIVPPIRKAGRRRDVAHIAVENIKRDGSIVQPSESHVRNAANKILLKHAQSAGKRK